MQRFRQIIARVAVGLVPVVLFTLEPLSAQQTTGKIEGTVSDQTGTAIANAQVVIVGASFGALTNDRGYYFLNNVPVGSYTLRAQFIGFAPTELRGVRVLGGQTATADLTLQPTAVVVGGITVEAAANPIVPRDQVATKTIVSGDMVDRLPIDDVRGILGLQAGVVETGSGLGVSIRGGRPGEANVYIDGAPVRGVNNGAQRITVSTNAVAEASVTTGALGVEFSDAQSGVIAFTTRTGGERLQGSYGYETDEPFGDAISIGFNRFEGSVGGPVPKVNNLRFFLSGALSGQVSPELGAGSQGRTTYVLGQLDTVVQEPDANGNLQSVAIPQFVQYSGECPSGTSGNAVRQAILNNYNFECQGRRLPMSWNTDVQIQGNLQYTYGRGSSLRLTGVANGNQFRNAPGRAIANPQLFSGGHNTQRLFVLNVSHQFFRSSERALALNANLSYANDKAITGPLNQEAESGTRTPSMGLYLGTLGFAGYDGFAFPIDEQIIRNIRTNTGTRIPLLNRTDLANSQQGRINPYGLRSGGWVTSGFNTGGSMLSESRLTGRVVVDWQANRFHRFTLGGDVQSSSLSSWSANFINQSFMDAYVVDPVKSGLFAADRLDLGDVVLELGVRWDHYNSNTLFPKTPFRIFTHPRYNQLYTSAPTNTTVYNQFLADTNIWAPSQGHSAISPRLRVSFPVTERTNFRLSYAHQVQSPEFSTLLQGINNDLSFTNTNDVVGRDLRFGKTILFEFGVQHAFSDDMVLDVSAYNKDKVSDFAARIRGYDDPANPGDTLNANILTNADFGNSRGLDIRLDRRVGNYVNASIAYTLQRARNTGSDPFSYLRTTSRQISQVTGQRLNPPETPLPQDDDRTHNLVGAIALTFPGDWRQGTMLGRVLQNTSAFMTFRVVSGQPYTRQRNEGSGATAPRQGFGLIGTQIEAPNSSRMPWIKNIDLRLNRGFRFGRTDWTLFLDGRNILNFKNITSLFTETSDVVNEEFRTQVLGSEYSQLEVEATAAGAFSRRSDLPEGGNINVASCATWTSKVNCFMLQRTEARFGDGNLTYTREEQERALNAFYDNYVAPVSAFYGAPRHIRVGFEVNF